LSSTWRTPRLRSKGRKRHKSSIIGKKRRVHERVCRGRTARAFRLTFREIDADGCFPSQQRSQKNFEISADDRFLERFWEPRCRWSAEVSLSVWACVVAAGAGIGCDAVCSSTVLGTLSSWGSRATVRREAGPPRSARSSATVGYVSRPRDEWRRER